MIKNLITATMLATASPLMVTGNAGTYRAAATIVTNGTPIVQEEENVKSEYYYIKEAPQLKPLNDTTIYVKGYQYTVSEYQDAETGWYTQQYIDYYIKTTNTVTNLSEIEYRFTGTSYNNSIEFSIDEYEIRQVTLVQDIMKIEGFYLGETVNYNTLTELRAINGQSRQLDDAGTNYLFLKYQTVYNYLKVRLQIYFYTDTNIAADAVQATSGLYNEIAINESLNAIIPPTVNYEVVDLGGLMFDILGMPFAWASIAFNLTLFPGTPYAINLSRLFFAILGSLILIIILKKVLK